MTRSLAILLGVLTISQLASAEPHHVLVLRAEGPVDDALRARIDAGVLKLAKTIPGTVEAADITFSDATAAVGCNWTDTSCKDQVLTTMGVDELVAPTLMVLPSGDLRVTVRRLPRGSAPQTASTTIPTGQPPDARMTADIGPMFGVVDRTVKPPAPIAKPTPPPIVKATTPPPTQTTTTTTTGTTTGEISTGTTPLAPETPIEPAPPRPSKPEPTVTAAPNNQVTQPPEGTNSHRRLEIYGMAGGGGLVVLGFLMWGAADGVQGDINKAPTKTPADFRNLRDLENKADSYSGAGNLFFVGGLVLGGISGYYFWRDHRAGSTQQASVAPAVFDHGAGITLTFGGGQ